MPLVSDLIRVQTGGLVAAPSASQIRSTRRHADARLSRMAADDEDRAAGVPPTPERPVAGEHPGAEIGKYRLLEVLGEGGFGTVWLAERRELIVQRVALKILKLGMDTKAVIARFEQERQALAVMDHPNVAKVHDAGVTATGRPYFVMEYVAGDPLTRYCDKHRLTIKQRLELFISVCDAVQHAHMKGIIHRDLKPANILVGVHGETPVPKVIDFGVAKALAHSLTDKTIFTETGQIIGTPEYMSPEQAEMQGADIDTRTDVYSLGAILYELLAGSLPLDSSRLRGGGYSGIQRMIREVQPPTPSKRLTSLAAEASTGIAERRRVRREELAALLRRELDWIPLKALRKDRTERYGSPADLARDIKYYLQGRPLEAGPESAAYRFRKLVSRNRGAFVAGTAVTAALVLGIVGFAWQAQIATRERDRATVIKDYLIETLQSSDPDREGKQGILLSEAMRGGVERLNEGALDSQPFAKAEILGASASILYSNGDAESALPLAQQALAIMKELHDGDHPDVAKAQTTLAGILFSVGRSAESESLLAEALKMRQRLFPGDHPSVAESLNHLAFVWQSEGKSAEAEDLAAQALEMYRRISPQDRSAIVESLSTLAYARESLGRAEEAELLSVQALEMSERLHKGDHPAVGTCMFDLARIRLALGRAGEAEQLLVRSLEMRRRIYKGDHPSVLVTLYNLAAALTALSRTDEAIARADEAVAMARRIYSVPHPALARALWRAGDAQLAAGHAAEALPLLEECVTVAEATEPSGHPRLKEYHDTLAKCRAAMSK